MRRLLVLVFVAALAMTFAFPQEGMCRRYKDNLHTMLSDEKEVKVYVADVTDSSGQAGDMLTSLKKKLEDAFATRMSVNFALVRNEDDADIVVKCDITERIWMKEDPVDQIHGIGAAALDVAMRENYARMQADFTVERGGKKVLLKNLRRIVKRHRVIWSQNLQATITKGHMSEEESIPLLEDRMAQVFMRKCFGRQAKMVGTE